MQITNGEILDFLAELSETCQCSDGEPIDVLRKVKKLVEEKFSSPNSGSTKLPACHCEYYSQSRCTLNNKCRPAKNGGCRADSE